MSMPVIVDDGETVARILHREWIVDGEDIRFCSP